MSFSPLDNTDSNQQVQQNQGMFTTHLNSILKDILPPEDDQQGDNLGEEESIDFGEVNDDIFGISEGMTDDSCSGNAFGFNRNEFGYKPQTVKVYNNVYKTDNENGQGNANDYERKEKKVSKTLQINSNNVYLQQQPSAMMISNGNSKNNECNINNNNFTFVNDNDNPLRNYFIKKTYNYPMYNQHHYQNLIPFPQQYSQSSPSLNNINTSHPLICHSQAQTQTLLQTSSQYKSSRRFNTSHYNPPHRKPTHLGSEMTIYLSELEHELRNSSHITISIFSSIRPRLLLIIKTQIGSRILQTYLPNSPNQVISLIYQDIYDKINVLLLDPYANYFLIKLFAALSTNERISFLQIIVKNIITFSSNKIATYPIQCIIGTISSPQEKMIIVSHLIKHIQKIAFDIYGTHVIEKAIICLEKEYTHDIVLYIINNFTLIANHVNSLCLAKKVLMLDNAHEFMPQLKTILVNNCYALIENPYGNYALQIVLDTWNESEIEDILATIQNNCIELSMMKYSSNVIEKCLQKSTVFLQAFVIQVCTTKSIGGLIRNSYGNYVVQTALKVAKGELKVILINEIENNLNMLGEKKLINKWKSILALNIIECVNQSDNNINSLERMQVRTKESGV